MMEPYHSKGEYLFLGVHPCGSDLEEAIAQTEVNSQSQRGIRSHDCHYITPIFDELSTVSGRNGLIMNE